MGLFDNGISVSWHSVVISWTGGMFNKLLVALNIIAEWNSIESAHLNSTLILIVTMRPRCRLALFDLFVPKRKLFGLTHSIWGNSLFGLIQIGIILRSVLTVGTEIMDIDPFLNIACSSVAGKTVTKLTWFLGINSFNISISLDIIRIGWRHILINFTQEKWSTLGKIFLFRFNRKMKLLLFKSGFVPIGVGKVATFEIGLESIEHAVHVDGLNRTIS